MTAVIIFVLAVLQTHCITLSKSLIY